MAFDSKGLLCAQLAASIEYAEDQGIILDDFEYRLVNSKRALDVEIYFTHPECKKPASDNLEVVNTHVKFVTMFQTIEYQYDGLSHDVTEVKSVAIDEDLYLLSHADQLRLISMAIEESSRF